MKECQLTESRRQAECLLHPQRAAILGELRQPGSAASVARRLGKPRQKVAYHVRKLEQSGLLRHVGDRKAGNCTERLLQASARHYAIDPDLLGELGLRPEQLEDRFSSAYQVASALQVAAQTARLRDAASAAGQKLATLTLETDIDFANARDQYRFARDLEASVRELVAKYHSPGDTSRTVRLHAFAYPGDRASPDGTETEAS